MHIKGQDEIFPRGVAGPMERFAQAPDGRGLMMLSGIERHGSLRAVLCRSHVTTTGTRVDPRGSLGPRAGVIPTCTASLGARNKCGREAPFTPPLGPAAYPPPSSAPARSTLCLSAHRFIYRRRLLDDTPTFLKIMRKCLITYKPAQKKKNHSFSRQALVTLVRGCRSMGPSRSLLLRKERGAGDANSEPTRNPD